MVRCWDEYRSWRQSAEPLVQFETCLLYGMQSRVERAHPNDCNWQSEAENYQDNLLGIGIDDKSRAVDWIREFALQRSRDQRLKESEGSRGYLQRTYEASKLWLVLTISSLALGFLAAWIDVVSLWLDDWKSGYCRHAFYLSKGFCCMGVDTINRCQDWIPWGSYTLKDGNTGVNTVISYVAYAAMVTSFASIAAFLTTKFAPAAATSGIPQIKAILAGLAIDKLLGWKLLVIKVLGLCLVVGSGLWLGKEGPLVHVACACASVVMEAFPSLKSSETRKREVYAALSAAGISVAFGAPIGGVLFTLETMAYYTKDSVMWQSFVCAMVASVGLQVLNPFRTGNLVLFHVHYDRNWQVLEILPFTLLGIIGGLCGTLLIELNIKFMHWRNKYKVWLAERRVGETAIVALLTACINYPNFFTRIQHSLLLSYLFQECGAPGTAEALLCDRAQWPSIFLQLVFAASVGLPLTAYSFGLSIPAGILMPSMIIGALIGRATGLLVWSAHQTFPQAWPFASCPEEGTCITPGVYALVGAASTLTGVTRLTVSSVVIMFELTGALHYVVPIMVGVMISKWVADSFDREGIYDRWISETQTPVFLRTTENNQHVPDISLARALDLVSGFSTGDEMINFHPIDLRHDLTVAEIEDKFLFQYEKCPGFPIVRAGILLGYASRADLLELFCQPTPDKSHMKCIFEPSQDTNDPLTVNLYTITDTSPTILNVNTSFQLAVTIFRTLGPRIIFAIRKGKLEGLLTRENAYILANSAVSDDSITQERDSAWLLAGDSEDHI